VSYKKEKLTERVIFRISEEEKTMINSILKKGIYKSQSELFRGAMGLILFFEEKLSLSEINNLYLRGSVQVMFSEIALIEKESKSKEQWKKLRKEIKDAKEEKELEINEMEKAEKEMRKRIMEHTQKMENLMREQRNVTIKTMISFIDILNKIPAGMKRKKLDLTKEGKLVKSLFISTKNKLEKLFLFYLRDTTKMSQTEIDELFKNNN